MINVSDLMTIYPVSIDQNANLNHALTVMKRVGCHHLPVIGSSGHVLGVVTVGDCEQALNGRLTVPDMIVRMVMSPAPIIIEPDSSVEEAARLMLTHHIGCLPVMRGETLVGIITTSDLMIALINLLHDRQPTATNIT
jgi:CBS domain-containing protein